MKTAMIAIVTTALMSTTAVAQDVCMSTTEMQSTLIDWYGESPVTEVSADDTRLWVSDSTGTWTLVRTMTGGTACVKAQGSNWSEEMDARTVQTAIEGRIDS